MSFHVPIQDAQAAYSEYTFVKALSPSQQKAAFHVTDADGNDLCLKIISPNTNMDRLAREIFAMQAIKHPNIAALKEYTFSAGHQHQRHYIVEEFVSGDDLTRFLAQTPWPLKQASSVFSGICDGLEALAEQAIVHRDLKPSNIRIRHDGSPVIIDFGLARILSMADLTNTSDGAGIGTPLYFSPEQFLGTKHDIDHRTDLFPVGVMLYEALVYLFSGLTGSRSRLIRLGLPFPPAIVNRFR
jgi:serine/threonine protein kinase